MGIRFWHFDITIAVLLVLLSAFGCSIILTIDRGLFSQQAAFLLIGLLLFLGLSRLDPLILFWFSPIAYSIGILFLFLSYFGPNIRGATRWIVVYGTQLQPSELVKPLIILGLSYFLMRFPPKTLKAVLFQLSLFIIPFLLVFRQPDLGSSIVYLIMWVSMLLAAGLPLWVFAGGGVSVAALVPLVWHFLASYQKMRVITFLSPTIDPMGAGYNGLQSMIAVGSGQLFGRGLGLGTQSHLRFLPEFHTDFIFATLVEEFGFLGGALLLLSYLFLLWHVMKPFVEGKENDAFAFIYTIGLVSMMLSQIAINSGMNMGILPITGITLPLISYGGSSLLSVFSSFGIFSALKKRTTGIAI